MATYPLQELYRDIETLPSDKLAELRQFIDFSLYPNIQGESDRPRFVDAVCWMLADNG